MRKSHIQPSHLNQQGKEESKNLRAEKRNPASSSQVGASREERGPTDKEAREDANRRRHQCQR
ncbi:hypothetical protein SESBI_32774 [Sesbania bispinosa]|nr:hypothetical protein SESBI_32774 [Sesbania bispinosa]